MKSKFSALVMTLAGMVGVPAAFGTGLVDLGPAGAASFDSNVGDNKPPCIVDVSKDGTVAGGTDSSGNPFIWTAANGKVSIGSSTWLVGLDWLSGTVLAVGNSSGANYPLYWEGNADGTGGTWTSLPAMDGNTGLCL